MTTTSTPTTRPTLAGRWLYFSPAGHNLGEPRFTVYSRRGNFNLGTIEMRGQWQDWAWYPVAGEGGARTPLNREMLAEIHAFMRAPAGEGTQPARAAWRLWLRERLEWLLRMVIRWL